MPAQLLAVQCCLGALVQCCNAAMQCDADMQVLNIGPLSLFEDDPGPRDKHCFYRPHGPASNCPAPAVPSLRRQLAADRRWRWSLQYLWALTAGRQDNRQKRRAHTRAHKHKHTRRYAAPHTRQPEPRHRPAATALLRSVDHAPRRHITVPCGCVALPGHHLRLIHIARQSSSSPLLFLNQSRRAPLRPPLCFLLPRAPSHRPSPTVHRPSSIGPSLARKL